MSFVKFHSSVLKLNLFVCFGDVMSCNLRLVVFNQYRTHLVGFLVERLVNILSIILGRSLKMART